MVGGICPIELFIIFSPVVIGVTAGFFISRYMEGDVLKKAELNVKMATTMTKDVKRVFMETLVETGDKEKANEASHVVWLSYANQHPENKLIQDYVYQVDTCKLYIRYKERCK